MHGTAVVVLLALFGSSLCSYPLPFYRELSLDGHESGEDVYLLQNLLRNLPALSSLPVTSTYDKATSEGVQQFQQTAHITADGIFGPQTAQAVLAQLSRDHYRDDNSTAASRGYLYKVLISVHANRSIEVPARLFAGNGTLLYTFTVRTHGADLNKDCPWPCFDNIDPGRNEFSSDGNTPTGLTEFDLNTPEDEPKFFGPYPVNRAVQGLEGNAKWLIPSPRNGLLLHTGEWPNWQPGMPMPNSNGCMHAYPDSIKTVWQLLLSLGVQARPNTDGKLPYPYKPQGLLSIELVD
eukprot:m.20667 g.20667  ORF g.20667 m.20667 type:complete len:293 (+) comp10599_c0_seq1:58-936(+)